MKSIVKISKIDADDEGIEVIFEHLTKKEMAQEIKTAFICFEACDNDPQKIKNQFDGWTLGWYMDDESFGMLNEYGLDFEPNKIPAISRIKRFYSDNGATIAYWGKWDIVESEYGLRLEEKY